MQLNVFQPIGEVGCVTLLLLYRKGRRGSRRGTKTRFRHHVKKNYYHALLVFPDVPTSALSEKNFEAHFTVLFECRNYRLIACSYVFTRRITESEYHRYNYN